MTTRKLPAITGTALLLMLLTEGGTRVVAADAGGYPDQPKPLRWPGEGGKKVGVSLGIVVVDFARLNLREESFDMAGYLDTSWIDPSLAIKPSDPPVGVRRYRPGSIWAPALEFVNAVEQVLAEREGDLYVADDGRVTQRVRFSHKFQSPLHLERFPFDRQTLTIVLGPFDPFARDLDLIVDPGRTGRLDEASVPDWEIEGVKARVAESRSGDSADKRFLFEIKVGRRSTFYVWRVLLPLTMLVIATWTVFWFEVSNLQPQISTGLAILLSFVTFNYAIDFSLPKVPYLTFIDQYSLVSFGFVLAVIFAVSAMHVILQRAGVGPATRLQAVARRVFPVAYLVAILAVAASSLS